MSFLRVCALSKYLNCRSLFVKCAVRMSFAECCQLCVSRRADAVRRISETSLQLQRRNMSLVNPITDDGKRRVLVQAQLLDVLKARINQLQSDIVLDVQHAKVQFVRTHSSARRVLSGKGPRSTHQEKTGISKSGHKEGASKSQPNRWKEKLSEEKTRILNKQQHVDRKLQKKVQEKPPARSKGNKSSLMLPGTSHKTIATKAKKTAPVKFVNKKNGGHMTLAEQIRAAVSPSVTLTNADTATAVPHKVSIGKPKCSKNQVQAQFSVEELAQVEELERRLSQQVSQSTSSNNPELRQENSEGSSSGDTQHCVRSYLEAIVFSGDIEKAHHFLLRQHRVQCRRKHLNTGVYNIMMRVWSKMGSVNQVGHVFKLLEEAELKPNLGSYCAALECMGRNPNCSPDIVTRCLSQMEKEDLSLDDIFSRCVFRQDERDMVLKAVHIVQPNYQPSLNATTNQCPSSLVQDLYNTQRADHHYPKLDFTREELQERFKCQLSNEQACTITIDSVEASKPVTKNMAKMRELLAEQRVKWQKVLLQALRDHKMILANTNTKVNQLNMYPYLCLLQDSEYVDIMMQTVATLPFSGESLKILASNLGTGVYTKYSMRQKQKNQIVEKLGNMYNAYTELLAKDTKEYNVLPREWWCKLEMEQSSGPTLQGGETHWPYSVILELGICMVDMMIKNLKIYSDILTPSDKRKLIPILYHMFTFRSTYQIGFIKPHPILSQIQQEAMGSKLTFDTYMMPMLCPPLPWASVKSGAYLLTPTKLMRTAEGATQHDVLLEKSQNLHPVLDSLNHLGNCAWKINKPLLDIIISIFNDRGDDELDIPPPLSEAPKIPHFDSHYPTYSASEKATMKREVIDAKKKYSDMHSLRMDALYKLSIANHMRDKTFWFPHNMDFRGRTYPCPPYFNHLGSDATRAVLLFAEGKPLGPKGLDWLKIHLINLTGQKKKSSLQGRLEFANTILEDILDSADNPLNGKRWWKNADEPWQALACCMEISYAVRSPDPTQFISHFPVQQDGSCNGLQHYAALGRDVIGAGSVNLMPCEVPQDVYSVVAQQVEERRVRDAKKNLKIAQILEGLICRKLVKQTVMTVVYGVTRYGGRLQIYKRLKEIDEFPKEHIWHASRYLVGLVFNALKEMFTGSREIQGWLTESARLISKSGHTVEWVTPLGLPIIQPYHHLKLTHKVKSTLQDISHSPHVLSDNNVRPNIVKQKNAFPPNFIHSLDSTHMMLTALHCNRAGLTFVSVHDCFWTHALTVDTMNKICREQFVALHNQPILQELSNFLLFKYCASPPNWDQNKKYLEYRKLMLLLAQVPEKGDFDLQQVKKSVYFFS